MSLSSRDWNRCKKCNRKSQRATANADHLCVPCVDTQYFRIAMSSTPEKAWLELMTCRPLKLDYVGHEPLLIDGEYIWGVRRLG